MNSFNQNRSRGPIQVKSPNSDRTSSFIKRGSFQSSPFSIKQSSQLSPAGNLTKRNELIPLSWESGLGRISHRILAVLAGGGT